MATEKQNQANRINAKAGGVKSLAGKAIIARNALKHGLTSERAVLPNEDPQECEQLSEGVHHLYKPEGSMEQFMTDRVASLMWRLRRSENAEHGLLMRGLLTQWLVEAREKAKRYVAIVNPMEDKLCEPFEQILDPEGKARAQKQIDRLSRMTGGADVVPGLSFQTVQESLQLLSQYETSIERKLLRCIHELERLQARRKGPEYARSPDSADETHGSEPSDE